MGESVDYSQQRSDSLQEATFNVGWRHFLVDGKAP